MNIDNVTVGGYSRSRCSGWYVSVISSSSGPGALPVNIVALLPGLETHITISQGWPPRLAEWMCSNDILPIPVSLPLLLQYLSVTHQQRCGLSKRHCT